MRKLLVLSLFSLLSSAAAAQPQGIWGERGISKQFVLRDNVLYAADGRGVSVYDVTNPAAIRRIDAESGDGEAVDLALAGDRDLVVATSKGIDRFAINTDGTLTRLATTVLSGRVTHIAASSSRVAAVTDQTLLVFERTADGLAISQQISFSATIRALELSGNVAFAAIERAGIHAIDVNSGETLNTIPVGAVDLALSGSTLWAAADIRGLFAIDVATRSTVGLTGGGELRLSRVAAAGSRVYAIAAPHTLHIFDGSKASEPRLIGSMTEWINVLAASGSRIFLAGATVDDEGFTFETGAPVRAFDLTNPAAAVHLGDYRDLAGPISGVWTDGSIAYVIDAPYLRVIDISTTTEPREMASIVVPDIQDYIRVKNGLAINYGRTWVVLIDVSQPRAPKVIGKWHTQGHAPSFAALARDTFVEANQHSGLHVVDYSDPQNPVQIAGRIFHYLDIAAGDDVIYTIQQATFLTADITDRTKVVDRTVHQGQYFQLETMPPNAPLAHHVVLRSKQGVVVYSVTEDRFVPQHAGFVPLSGLEMLATNDTTVFAARDGVLHTVAVPGGTGFVETGMAVTSPMQMSVAGEKVVIADRYRLRVYGPDTAPPPPPPPPPAGRRRSVAH